VTAFTGSPGTRSAGKRKNGTNGVNVAPPERWASVIGGTALAVYGLSRRSLGGAALALAARLRC
jgi:uncharacterized membrane protein